MPNILVIDVGNTSTTLGIFCERGIVRVIRHPTHEPAGISSAARRAAGRSQLDGAVLGSVVPGVNAAWQRMLLSVYGVAPLMVHHRLKMNVKLDYPRPETIGADRIANAVAAWDKFHRAVIVADFGTALTFDVINSRGAYIGGVIAPGLPLMLDYLSERTAMLPHISLEGPCGAIGRTTREAMRIGALIGYRGMVREIFQHVRSSVPDERQAVFCATGGHAERAIDGLGLTVELDQNLTLTGLGLLYQMNLQSSKGAKP
ncbi:MAG: type III pantothenate kinase [bacterium]